MSGWRCCASNLLNAITAQVGGIGDSPYSSLSAVGFGITSSGTVTFDNSAFQTAAKTDYSAVASLLGAAGRASNAECLGQVDSRRAAGTYAVNVTTNSGGSVTGTINGLAASGDQWGVGRHRRELVARWLRPADPARCHRRSRHCDRQPRASSAACRSLVNAALDSGIGQRHRRDQQPQQVDHLDESADRRVAESRRPRKRSCSPRSSPPRRRRCRS